MITPVTSHAEARVALVQLQGDIEALAQAVDHVDVINPPVWSKTAQGTPFVTICNGFAKAEDAPSSESAHLDRLAANTLTTAATLRRSVDGPARLTWRAFSYDDGNLWIRLAFEPL